MKYFKDADQVEQERRTATWMSGFLEGKSSQ
jgi:hypothetical protein